MEYNDYQKSEIKTIVVTDEFIDIYRKFNISSQSDKMKSLSERELYLLLLVCLDKHSEDDPVCTNNYIGYSSELKEIYDLQDDKDTTNQYLIDLSKESGDNYIDIECIVDSKGDKLPEPLEKPEVRDAKIDNLLGGSK